MAWSAPMTAVANSVFTAAQFNTYVRDNLNETGPAKATTDGRFIVTNGANSIVERAPVSAQVTASETTGSTSFTDLTTPGPSVSVTTGTSALYAFAAETANNTGGSYTIMDFAVSGASTRSPTANTSVEFTSASANQGARVGVFDLITGLTAGVNVFTCKYAVGSNTGTWGKRRLIVIPL